MMISYKKVTVTGTIFENNTALSSGGAMYVSGRPDSSGQGATASGTTLVLKGSAFRNNTAFDYGGAVYIKNDLVRTFLEN